MSVRPHTPTTLHDVRTQRGGTWGPDNTIVFSPFSGALRRISANGGQATPLEQPDDDAAHVRPHFLAGTRQLLYRVTSRNGRSNSYYVTSQDSAGRKLIGTFDSGNVTYSHGHLLFMQSNTLMAQPFDPEEADNHRTSPSTRRQRPSLAWFTAGVRRVLGVADGQNRVLVARRRL